MELVDVDAIGPESAETLLTSLPHLSWREAAPFWLRCNLARDDDIVSATRDRAADEHLRHAVAVHLRGIDPIDPGVDAAPDGVDHHLFRLVGPPRGAARLPGAVADDRDLRTTCSELPSPHAGETINRGAVTAGPAQ